MKIAFSTIPVLDKSCEEVAAIASKLGYDGCFSLEWESKWKSEIENAYDTPEAALAAYTDFLKKLSL